MGKRSLTLHTKWPFARVPSSEKPDIALTCLVEFGVDPTRFFRDWTNRLYSTLHPNRDISSM
jgi:hypothetical protein